MRDPDSLQDIGMQFTETILRIKHCQPLWCDLLKKSAVFNERLRLTCASYGDYLDCLQRIVDVAQHQEGGAKDIAPILTKMYVKQRNMESKLDNLCRLLSDGYNTPMKEKLKEWKETCEYLDTKHCKETKRRVEEVRKAMSETEKLKKKVVKKGKTKKQGQLCDAERSKETMRYSLQQFEQHALRGALIQERAHFCAFVSLMTPAWEVECQLMDDGTHLRDVVTQAVQVAALPTKLPADAEASIHKIRLISNDTAFESCDLVSGSNQLMSPRSSFISTNSSSTSGVSSGGSFNTLPNSPKDAEPAPHKYSCTQFSSFDSLARSYPASDQTSSAYGSSPSVCQTTPRGLDIAPRSIDIAPRGIDTAPPRGIDTAPRGIDTAPRGIDAAPRGIDTAPRSIDTAPRGIDTAPRSLDIVTRGVLADINKFVEQSQINADQAPPLNKSTSPPIAVLGPKEGRKRGSGEYSSLSPVLNSRHSMDPPVLNNRHSMDSRHSMDTYQNLGELTGDTPKPDITTPDDVTTKPDDVTLTADDITTEEKVLNTEQGEEEEPLYENIAEQECLYDVPPPQLPPSRSTSLSRRPSSNSENTVTAYLERRRSVLSQNRSSSDLRGSQDLHSSRHSVSSSHYARPPSVCSNHSNSGANTTSFNSFYNSNGSIAYSVQQFAQPKSNGYASRSELQNSSGGYATQQNSSGGYATQQNSSGGYATQQKINYHPLPNNHDNQSHGYAAQDHRRTDVPHYAAQDHRRADAPHYAVQQRRSESRLSLKSQPPHYATMTARPNKRTYSLTSLNAHNSAGALHHGSTNSLSSDQGSVLSAVDPLMPPPPPPEVGVELSELCHQITRGGTLRPSQMRMMGLRAGDTSTIKRKDSKSRTSDVHSKDSRTPDNSFEAMLSFSHDIQHLNLNK